MIQKPVSVPIRVLFILAGKKASIWLVTTISSISLPTGPRSVYSGGPPIDHKALLNDHHKPSFIILNLLYHLSALWIQA